MPAAGLPAGAELESAPRSRRRRREGRGRGISRNSPPDGLIYQEMADASQHWLQVCGSGFLAVARFTQWVSRLDAGYPAGVRTKRTGDKTRLPRLPRLRAKAGPKRGQSAAGAAR